MTSSDFVEGKEENLCDPFEMRKSLAALDINSPKMKELQAFLIEKKVAVTSTLPVFEPYTGREVVPGGGIDALAPSVKERVLKQYARAVNHDEASSTLFTKEMAWEKQFL